MSGDTLTVRVTLTVKVDRQAYDEEYGERASAADIRQHVKGEAYSATESAFQNIDAITVESVE